MTREEIMRLEGRELDAAVARMVFGLQPVYVREEPFEIREDQEMTIGVYCNFGGAVFTAEREWVVNDYVLPCRDGGLNGGHILPHYSSDIAAAWQVVEMMAERGYHVEISYHPYPGFWTAIFRLRIGRRRFAARGSYTDKQLPRTIARAALLAVCGGGEQLC